MVSITTNALALADRYRKRRQRLNRALGRGLKRAAAAVDRAQVENLSGPKSAEPGSYPVPIRTATLVRGHFFQVNSYRLAFVGNTTEYAAAVHQGRPFLDDAIERVDVAEIMAISMRQAVFAT